MLRHKAYRFRIYPNKKQEILIAKTIGCSRFVYNYFLSEWDAAYIRTGKGMSYSTCCAMLPQMKKAQATIWLREVDSIALQASVKNLSDSYCRFFNKQNRRPRFKSKNNPVQSYTTKNVNNNITVLENAVKLPKLGLIKLARSQEINGRTLNAAIRRKASGKYYISLLCEEDIQQLPKTESVIGIDLGITDFAALSDGRKVDNNKFTYKMEQKLKREQRKLSRRALRAKKRGTRLFEAKNYQKQRRKVARLHERVINQRTDFLNKFSTEIVKNHDIICIEDLNTKGMLQGHKLAKSLSDVSWSGFVSRIQYKADWYGREMIKVDRWFASSQICSECGHKDGRKTLDIRHWVCPVCHKYHDRDINASKNILAEGLRINALV